MKNKKLIKSVLFGCIPAVALAVIAGAQISALDAEAEYTLSGIEYEEEYAKNTRLQIQNGTLKDGDKEYAAEALVRFPDGSYYKTSEVILSQEGQYTVEYSSKIDGKVQMKCIDFSVHSSVYSVNDSMSSVTYGLNKNSQTDALTVSLVEGDVLSYKPVIDLTKVTAGDELIRFKVSSSYDGVKDFTAINVRLTDIYDPDNYVTINVTRDINDKTGSSLYCKGAANGQPLTGRNQRFGVVKEGGPNGHIGTYITCSTLKVVPMGYCSLSYDYMGKTAFVNSDSGTLTIVDLDSPEYFDGNEWKENFTTGEVYLSVYCDGYESASANLIIENILGNDLSIMKYVDETAPRISIDYAGNRSAVNAVINRPYKTYEATAFDNEDGFLPVNTRVYYNYGARTQVEVNVENGAFNPTLKGCYTIVYTAKDVAGNESKTEIEVYSDTRANALDVEIDETRPTGQAGSFIGIANAIAKHPIGKYEITVNVYDGEVLVADNVQGGFIPEHKGVYKIEYVCRDYIDEKKASYTIEVVAGTVPIVTSEVEEPRFLYADVETQLPALVAYDYSGDDKTEINPAITVKDDGEERMLDGYAYTPVCSGASTVATFVYTYTNEHGTVDKEYQVPIVRLKDDDGWLLQNYFYGENITTSVDATGVIVETSKDTSFTFVKEVLDDLSINFFFPTYAFTQFDMYLQDAENADEVLKFTFTKNNDVTTIVQINDGSTKYTFSGSFEGGSGSSFNLFYNPYAKKFYDNAGNNIVVEKALNGDIFDGFTSRKLIMTFALSGVIGTSQMAFSRLNGQLLSDSRLDQIAPGFVFKNEQLRACYINETFKVGGVLTLDVLDVQVTAFMTVKDTKQNVAKDINGKPLMNVPATEVYEVMASDYGTYTISIQLFDGTNNPTRYSTVVNILDVEPPTVEFSVTKMTAKVGQKVTLPTVTVTDNNDKKPSVYMFIYFKGSLKSVDKEFTPTEKGDYAIRIMAQDKSGNITVKEIELKVS